MTALRWTTGVLGLGLMVVGLVVLLTDEYVHDPVDVAIWLAAAIAVHDGLLAPLTLGVGLALSAVRPVRGRRIVQGALMVTGCLTLVALPVLIRPGPRANPTVLPLNYLADWLLLLAIVVAVSGLLLIAGRRRPPVHARKRPDAGGSRRW